MDFRPARRGSEPESSPSASGDARGTDRRAANNDCRDLEHVHDLRVAVIRSLTLRSLFALEFLEAVARWAQVPGFVNGT